MLSTDEKVGSTRRRLIILLLAAAGLRVGWVVFRYGGDERAAVLTYPDEEAYWQVASSLAAGGGLVDEFGFRATYMPAYPGYLALFSGLPAPLFWARIGQALIGALVAPATFLFALRWRDGCGSPTPGGMGRSLTMPVLAGLAAAFDPFLVFFSGLLLTETFFAVALITAWTCVLPMVGERVRVDLRTAMPAGLMLWVCVMLRPSAVVLVVLAPTAVLIRRRFSRGSLAAAGVMVGTVIVLLAPWAARNRVTIGEWRWLTTRGGISLYDGLRAEATGASDLAHTKDLLVVSGRSETQWDAVFRAEAVAVLQAEPLRAIKLAGAKFRRTWHLTPNVETYRRGPVAWISGVWMLGLLASAALGAWGVRKRVADGMFLLTPVIAFTLLHMVFVGSVRYRVPVMPLVAVLSAVGITGLIAWRRSELRIEN